MYYGDYYWGFYRDYYRDPFPHSLLRRTPTSERSNRLHSARVAYVWAPEPQARSIVPQGLQRCLPDYSGYSGSTNARFAVSGLVSK